MDLPPSSSNNEHKIEAIRELLFGQEIADLNSLIQTTEKSLRFNQLRLEDRLEEKLQEMNDRLLALEKSFSKELDKNESFAEETRCHHIILKNKIALVVDQLKQLETQFDGELQELTDAINLDLKSLANDIESGLAKVGNQSTARKELGDLLIKMGVTIQGSTEGESQLRSEPQNDLVLTR